MYTIQDKVIARSADDSIRVYDVNYDADELVVYSSWKSNHLVKEVAVIQFSHGSPFFLDGYDETTVLIHLSELIKE